MGANPAILAIRMVQEEVFCLEMSRALPQGKVWEATFRDRFCERFNCPPSAYEEAVFWKCIHWHAWLPALILFRRNRALFKEDLEFIHELGGIREPLIFKSELNRFHGRNVRERGWIRGAFHIRVSAKRVINLKNRLFRPAS
jgi:hypothetical protein